MDKFDAFLRGTRTNGITNYPPTTNPKEFGIPENFHEVFRLGLELNACLQLVMASGNIKELDNDICEYDECVAKINEHFGHELVKPYQSHWRERNEITHPETGETHTLFHPAESWQGRSMVVTDEEFLSEFFNA